MIAIDTDRLAIRNFISDDWQDLQEMIVLNEGSEVAKYDHEWPTSAEEIKDIAEWFASGDNDLAVCLKSTPKLIGLIALHRDEKEEGLEFNLGYIFHAGYHGRGYATEGCRAVIDTAFSQLAADRVITGTAAANEPSCKLLRRLGMRETGQGTGSFRKTKEGKPVEFVSLSFALSRDDWLQLGQTST